MVERDVFRSETSKDAPTHLIHPGASVQVFTHQHLLKWVIIQSPFQARLLEAYTKGKHKSMGLFEAWGDFDTLYRFDDGREDMVVRKHTGEQFYAFTHPEDRKVEELPKKWVQGAFY